MDAPVTFAGMHRSRTFGSFADRKLGSWFKQKGKDKEKPVPNRPRVGKCLGVVQEVPKIGSDGESEEASGASDEMVPSPAPQPKSWWESYRTLKEKRMSLPANVVISVQDPVSQADCPMSRTHGTQSQAEDPADSYIKLEEIMNGEFYTLHKGKHKKTGRPLIIKEITYFDRKKMPLYIINSSVLMSLNHHNIAKFISESISESSITLVYEAEKTDLHSWMIESVLVNARVLLFQLLRGLAYCHVHLWHGDLRPRNILINKKLELKISNFGVTPVHLDHYSNESLRYRPPEEYLGCKACTEADMWSVGCIFYELVTERTLFHEYDHLLESTVEYSVRLQRIFTILGEPKGGVQEYVQSLRPDYQLSNNLEPKTKVKVPERDCWAEFLCLADPAALCLLNSLLSYHPSDRVSAKDAMLSPFFFELGPEVHNLSDTESIFSCLAVANKNLPKYEWLHNTVSSADGFSPKQSSPTCQEELISKKKCHSRALNVALKLAEYENSKAVNGDKSKRRLHKSSTFSNFGNHKFGNLFSTLGHRKTKPKVSALYNQSSIKISKSLSVVHEAPYSGMDQASKIGSDGESEEVSAASDEVTPAPASYPTVRLRRRQKAMETINKRLSLPANVIIPPSFLEKLSVSPTLDGPMSRTLRRQSLSEIGFGKIESYIRSRKLGEGTYATVYRGISKLTKKVVALKQIRLEHEEGAPCTAIREVSLLKDLKHHNIVTLHDIIHTEKSLTLVFEYMDLDLRTFIEKHPALSIFQCQVLLFQLLRGLDYCHKRRVLHRDLKPQNLLINKKLELKLADFGLARAKSVPIKTYSHEVVTLWYRPPDVLLGSTDYTTSLDMWGVGCIFYEMATRYPLFRGSELESQLELIFAILGRPTEEQWPGFSSLRPPPPKSEEPWPRRTDRRPEETEYRDRMLRALNQKSLDLLDRLLVYNPRNRISAADAMKAPFFHDLGPHVHNLHDTESIFNSVNSKGLLDVDESVFQLAEFENMAISVNEAKILSDMQVQESLQVTTDRTSSPPCNYEDLL